jgi:hypothetical protein
LGTPLGQQLGVLLLLPSLRQCWSLRQAHPTPFLILLWRFLVNGVGRMICSMWRRIEEEAINRRTPRAKGAPNRARSGLGRSAQARFGPGFLPGCFSCDSLFVCTCMWAFDVVSFTVKAWILAIQASLFSRWVPEDLHVDASVLGSFGVMFITCLLSGFMIFFQSAWWTYPESLLFSIDFLRKQWTPKLTCKSELVIYGG